MKGKPRTTVFAMQYDPDDDEADGIAAVQWIERQTSKLGYQMKTIIVLNGDGMHLLNPQAQTEYKMHPGDWFVLTPDSFGVMTAEQWRSTDPLVAET